MAIRNTKVHRVTTSLATVRWPSENTTSWIKVGILWQIVHRKGERIIVLIRTRNLEGNRVAFSNRLIRDVVTDWLVILRWRWNVCYSHPNSKRGAARSSMTVRNAD